MKFKKIILSAAVILAGLSSSSCMGLGWSVSSDPYGVTPDVGISISGGSYYDPGPPPPPRPMPPRPTPWGGSGWPGPW